MSLIGPYFGSPLIFSLQSADSKRVVGQWTYSEWATHAWSDYFMRYADILIDPTTLLYIDGIINDAPCTNDPGCAVIWTYNQGVALRGLALGGTTEMLERATTLLTASRVYFGDDDPFYVMTELGCQQAGNYGCNGDQKMFKGIFMRYVGYVLPVIGKHNATVLHSTEDFVVNNSRSMIANDSLQRSATLTQFGEDWRAGNPGPGPDEQEEMVDQASAAQLILTCGLLNLKCWS
jgi:predicted alpha-1,6-mannanase (GH76 family)